MPFDADRLKRRLEQDFFIAMGFVIGAATAYNQASVRECTLRGIMFVGVGVLLDLITCYRRSSSDRKFL
jgi:hypothetical protein